MLRHCNDQIQLNVDQQGKKTIRMKIGNQLNGKEKKTSATKIFLFQNIN